LQGDAAGAVGTLSALIRLDAPDEVIYMLEWLRCSAAARCGWNTAVELRRTDDVVHRGATAGWMDMKRPSRATLLGLAGLAIIAASVGQRVWQALGAAVTPTVHVCAAAHYKLTTNRCTHDDHTLTVGAAGRAYVVAYVPNPANAINAFQVVQIGASGTTTTIANLVTNLFRQQHYVISLAALWETDGNSITPGAYQIVITYGTGQSKQYALTITQPARPAQPTRSGRP
jgi:hypothetical protein